MAAYNDLGGRYRRYKEDTKILVQTLGDTAMKCGYSSSTMKKGKLIISGKKVTLSVDDLPRMADFITHKKNSGSNGESKVAPRICSVLRIV